MKCQLMSMSLIVVLLSLLVGSQGVQADSSPPPEYSSQSTDNVICSTCQPYSHDPFVLSDTIKPPTLLSDSNQVLDIQIAETLPILETPPMVQDFDIFSKSRWNIWLPVSALSQRNSGWASEIMQTCGHTIGSHGCLLTSATMVFRFYGSSKNPRQVNQCMGDLACPWKFWEGATYCSENKAHFLGVYSPTYSNFVWSLSQGYPPILEVGGHWVVIYAVSGSGTQDSHFYIVDPWDGRHKSLTAYSGSTKQRLAIYAERNWTKFSD